MRRHHRLQSINRRQPGRTAYRATCRTRFFSAMCLIGVLVCLLMRQAVSAAGRAMLSLDAPEWVEQGDELLVILRVRLPVAATAGEIELQYDAEAFEFVGVSAERYDEAEISGAYEDIGVVGYRFEGTLPPGVNEIGKLTLRARCAPGGRVQVGSGTFQAGEAALFTEYGSAYRFVAVSGSEVPLETTAYTTTRPTEPDGSPVTTETERDDERLPGLMRTSDERTESVSIAAPEAPETPASESARMPRRTVVLLIAMFALLLVIFAILFLLLKLPQFERPPRRKTAGTRPSGKRLPPRKTAPQKPSGKKLPPRKTAPHKPSGKRPLPRITAPHKPSGRRTKR